MQHNHVTTTSQSVKFSLSRTQRRSEGRGIVLVIFNLYTRWGWAVIFTPRSFTLRKERRYPPNRSLGGPRADLYVLEKRKLSCPTGIRNLDRQDHRIAIKNTFGNEVNKRLWLDDCTVAKRHQVFPSPDPLALDCFFGFEANCLS